MSFSEEVFNITAMILNEHHNNGSDSNHGYVQSEEDLELLGPKWQMLIVLLYSVTATFSFVGNAIAIWVLTAGKRSSRELRVFLVNLSMSDITMALFSIPFTYTDFMLGRWIFPPVLCPAVQFMQLASVFVSVYTLTVIGIDRYIAIIYPLASSRLTKSFGASIVLIIWALGIALGSVSWFNSEAVPLDILINKTVYDCKETWSEENAKIYTLVIFIVTFALPISVLAFSYASVTLKMLRHTTPGNADIARDEAQNKAKLKVIKMLLTIVVLFVFCWLPIHILQLMVAFGRNWINTFYTTEHGYNTMIAVSFATHWLAMANSFVNPIIYCFMSENFRTDLKILLRKCSPMTKKKRQRRGTTIRSSDSLHSYRTSVTAMSTRNNSNTGHSLVVLNSVRSPLRRDSDNIRVNGNSKSKIMCRVSQID